MANPECERQIKNGRIHLLLNQLCCGFYFKHVHSQSGFVYILPYLLFGQGSPPLTLVEGRELSEVNWGLGSGLKFRISSEPKFVEGTLG